MAQSHANWREVDRPRHFAIERTNARSFADNRSEHSRQALSIAPQVASTTDDDDDAREVVQVEVGRAQHAPQSMNGGDELAGLVASVHALRRVLGSANLDLH